MENKKKFGYTKLYKVTGSNAPEKPIIYRIKYNDVITIMFQFSSQRPPFPVSLNNIKYALPGQEVAILVDNLQSEKPEAMFFTEISCFMDYEDVESVDFGLKAIEFSSIIDLIAGIIGLRLHKQLILEI